VLEIRSSNEEAVAEQVAAGLEAGPDAKLGSAREVPDLDSRHGPTPCNEDKPWT
jgi:hypothetical protein